MAETKNEGLAQYRMPDGFDYHSAILVVSDETFGSLAKHSYQLIEWCIKDAIAANREGAGERLSKRLGFLSTMASYFGANPIEKLCRQIDKLLPNESMEGIDFHLTQLQVEVGQFLPVLRERLSVKRSND